MKIKYLNFLCILLIIFPFNIFANTGKELKRATYRQKFKKTVSSAGVSLTSVDNPNGNVTVRGVKEGDIEIRAVKKVTARSLRLAKDITEEIEIEVEKRGSIVYIRTIFPEIDYTEFFRVFKRRIGMSVDYDITLPSRLNIDVRNKYGDVSVDNINELDVDNVSGNLFIKLIGGRANLKNSYGSVIVSDVSGDLTSENKSGKTKVYRVKGSVRIENSYDKVILSDIDGTVDVVNKSGSVEVSNAGSNVDLETSYDNVDVNNVKGGLTVINKSGKVRAEYIDGFTSISTTYANVTLKEVKNGARIMDKSGSVIVSNIDGNLTVETSYDRVEIEDVTGSVKVYNKSGGVSLLNIGGDAEVSTSYNPVNISRVKGKVTVDSKSGKVSIKKAGRSVNIKTSYNPVILNDIGGSVEVINKSGSVYADSVAGSVDIVTTYSSIELYRIGGSVTASTSSGNIEADLHFQPDCTYRMETSYGNILLNISGEINAYFTAIVPKYEEIELLGGLQITTNKLSREKITGVIGDGSGEIYLEVRKSGHIRVRKVR